jgi:hypothetical protein
METIQKIRANEKMAMIQYLHKKILFTSADLKELYLDKEEIINAEKKNVHDLERVNLEINIKEQILKILDKEFIIALNKIR